MSTKRSPKAIAYQVETTDEAITPRAGLGLLQEMVDSIGLVDSIDRAMPLPGSGRGLPASAYVISSVLLGHAGGDALDDMRELRQDQALRTLLRFESVPTPTALGSWLRRMGGNWEGNEAWRRSGAPSCLGISLASPRSPSTSTLPRSTPRNGRPR